ncbi:related to MIP1 - DNA-directed DNA polymerase gamma catalytic subunit, mitochondrial [Pseudozyma flocculosa]|uniref:Mitochondrial DNA polymerase catalytic subunit n=1 Tax=Pseudozyma flocculosa TaxID=84751 RepID=A0A5C3F9H2_9BASI|nr:related to MIP1 - DNA-directed DNA polymerase gamma catalytic subunit, mitochondrial [Pseudozyma flocculosa]
MHRRPKQPLLAAVNCATARWLRPRHPFASLAALHSTIAGAAPHNGSADRPNDAGTRPTSSIHAGLPRGPGPSFSPLCSSTPSGLGSAHIRSSSLRDEPFPRLKARLASTMADAPTESEAAIPRNAVGVQLLPVKLHAQLFPKTSDPVPPVDKLALSISKDHLSQHGLKASQAATLPQTSFDLPALQGRDLAEHFWTIGREVAQPWLGMAHELASFQLVEPPEEIDDETARNIDDFRFDPAEWINLDPSLRTPDHLKPIRWSQAPGWTRYPILRSEDGTESVLGAGESVPYPDQEDDALVFDVETMVSEGPYPVMATAAGKRAWYSWLSPWLVGEGPGKDSKHHLIPLGPSGPDSHPRLVVGHNVSYDRARTLEEYSLDLGSTRWLDTMSLHVATRGISSPQRPAWMQHNKAKAEKRAKKLLQQSQLREETRRAIENALSGIDYDAEELEGLKLEALDQDKEGDVGSGASAEGQGDAEGPTEGEASPFDLDLDGSDDAAAANAASKSTSAWLEETSKNSLADVARLHKVQLKVSKTARDAFVDGTPREEILAKVQHLLSYCASDVLATHQIFCKVWTDFAERCPHPATVAGVLHLGSTLLPVDDEWLDYKARCERQFNEVNSAVTECLLQLAEKLKEEGTAGVSWLTAEAIAAEKQPSADGKPGSGATSQTALDRPRVWWEDDPWYSQLDWTPKKPKKARRAQPAQDGEEVVAVASAFEVPAWYRDAVVRNKTKSGFGPKTLAAQQLLRLHLDGAPLIREGKSWTTVPVAGKGAIEITGNILGAPSLKKHGAVLESRAGSAGERVLAAIKGELDLDDDEVAALLREVAEAAKALDLQTAAKDVQLSQLDWSPKELRRDELMATTAAAAAASLSPSPDGSGADVVVAAEPEWWPKWFWDLVKSSTGELAVTIRSAVAPLLLKVSWRGCPLFRSREHGWTYRLNADEMRGFVTRQKPLAFKLIADEHLQAQIDANSPSQPWPKGRGAPKTPPSLDSGIHFFKVPHSEGESANVGSPFAKNFIPYFEDGTLQSQHPDEIGQRAARTALDLNAQCSYWIAVRDRVDKQMVVWDGEAGTRMGYGPGVSGARSERPGEAERAKGLILPQVVSMGTVTRRATENTWLTASNAKKNRLGSELKAMVKAPPGYSLVGADVDSEELWICSVMGDAQFGIHGATAIGWMTLEGTKAHGTDLHSKTASILGISRNQAKVFNYSRIYGAGIKHATQLLLKANPSMVTDEATKLAKELYAATKGQNTHTDELFDRKFWFGGTESYVFNKLESIALSDRPQTPALDCGVTNALTKKYLGKVDFGNGRLSEEYMPSRINWVVQSSGVDYLHLLITSMEWLCRRYSIDARFMLSVHDEVRYLARDHDRYRAAMALQIANLWTRSMFAFKLQMDDLPLGCAFFTAVDVDKVLRKEADDPCVTPSHPEPLPSGEALEIQQILDATNNGSLYLDGRTMDNRVPAVASVALDAVEGRSQFLQPDFPAYVPSTQMHRSTGQRGLNYLQAQASKEIAEIRALEQRAKVSSSAAAPGPSKPRATRRTTAAKGTSRLSEDDWVQSCADEASATAARPSKPRAKRASATASTAKSSGKAAAAVGNGQRRGFSTRSAGPGSPSTLDLDSLFPNRPSRPKLPFYRTFEHRRRILYGLYRPLLRSCPKGLDALRGWVRYSVRKRKSLTSARLVDELFEEGCQLVETFRQAGRGDAKAMRALKQKDLRIRRRLHRLSWRSFWAKKLHELRYPRRIPHHSGALLPPTISNRPLPRYKPVQPVAISMMIFKRRLARLRRAEKLAEVDELQAAQHGDAAMLRDVLDSEQLSSWTGFREWRRHLVAPPRAALEGSGMLTSGASIPLSKHALVRRDAVGAARGAAQIVCARPRASADGV